MAYRHERGCTIEIHEVGGGSFCLGVRWCQIPDRTEWHNIVASNRWAEIVDKYVRKGERLYLEGKIRTRSYSDQSGAMRYITEIYVDYMEMLSSKGANPGAGASASGQPAMGQQQQPVAGQPQQAQPIQDNPADDLPF